MKETNTQAGHRDKCKPSGNYKVLREVGQGDPNSDVVGVRQVGRKGFLEEVKWKLQEWYTLARDYKLSPVSRWQRQHVQSHKGSGHTLCSSPVHP